MDLHPFIKYLLISEYKIININMQLSTMNTIKCFHSLILKDNINYIMYTYKIHVFLKSHILC